MSLQTQALLEGLHFHLIVSEANCPLCNKTSLHNLICLYSITVDDRAVSISNHYEPRLSILLHNVSPVDADVIKAWKEGITTCNDVDIHVVDSMASKEADGKMQLDFYLPVSVLQKDYTASVIVIEFETLHSPVFTVMMHRKLSSCQLSDSHYLISKCLQSQLNMVSSTFGGVTRHSGNAKYFESVIILSDQSISALQQHQLTIKQLSPTNIDFIIGALHIEISYPYPVDYSRMSVKLSRKSQNIIVVAYRKLYQFYEEKPIYIVNPDNILSLPVILSCKENDLEYYSGIQFSLDERMIMQKTNRNPKLMPPKVNIKETFATILQPCKENFFQLVYDGAPANEVEWCQNVQCFLVVQNRVFDLQNKTPCIDLYFCFLTPEKCKTIYMQWIYAYENEITKLRNIFVDKNECLLLQNVFNYFASQTVSTLMKPACARYKLLEKHGISQYFTRAVVYPLYSNSNMTGLQMPKPFDPISPFTNKPVSDQKKCSFCGKLSENLKKCSRCRLTQYCNQECQKKHWGSHKRICNPQKPI